MIYQIKCKYETGDSFGTREDVYTLEVEWENLEVAKENLERIKEHYTFHSKINGRPRENKEEIAETFKNYDWFVPDKFNYFESLSLYTDKGERWTLHAPYMGYFEKLHEARIVIKDEVEGLVFYP